MNAKTKLETIFCADGLLERPRYFPRQLITPTEMTLEQNYFRDKMRRHNRLLHGWGVVCGAGVCLAWNHDHSDAEPWRVIVHPGYILGPYGDEILIDQERTVDLRTEGLIGICGDPASQSADGNSHPWCSDVFIRRDQNQILDLYIAVKYKELLSRPVRTQPSGCSCGDAHCEYSRWCDGYEIGILSQRPTSCDSPTSHGFADLFASPSWDCPACPTDPWVVLARVRIHPDGVIEEIDNCSCRRMVVSFSQIWGKCETKRPAFKQFDDSGVITTKLTLKPGESKQVTIIGENLSDQAEISMGGDVTATIAGAGGGAVGNSLKVDFTVLKNPLRLGSRDLRITNPDCATTLVKEGIQILEPGAVRSQSLEKELEPRIKSAAKSGRLPRSERGRKE